MATDPVVIADRAVSKVTSLVCSWLLPSIDRERKVMLGHCAPLGDSAV